MLPALLRTARFGAVALASCLLSASAGVQGLGLIGTYDSGLGGGATEIAAYDAAGNRLFVVNSENGTVDIIDLADLTDPTLITSLDVSGSGPGTNSGAGANSVAVWGNMAQSFTDNSGYFWFFSEDNVEITVKILDTCGQDSNNFWVFAAGMTNVEVELTVTDTVTGETKVYENEGDSPFQPIQDTAAFDTCP